jgi:pantetheine-phosphate adenylyltransferase
MKRAVYAGSFDPITNGHLWMIKQGAQLFDQLIVAIGINPDKKYKFGLSDRIVMIRESISDDWGSIKVTDFVDQFLVDFATSTGAEYILRGVRSVEDYEFERGMRHVNSDLCPDMSTIFLMPPREISEVSSSLVRGLIGPKGWKNIVGKYVPEPVLRIIEERK